MNKRDYLTLHLDRTYSKGTYCSKKGFRCKWKREAVKHYTYIQIKVKEQRVVRKDLDVNEKERLSNITHRHKLKQSNRL
jgi:hypothetical protein